MLTTSRDDLVKAARSLRDHGASRSDHMRHQAPVAFLLADYDMLGYNYRMTDIQGALGSAQMDRADTILDRRRELAGAYDSMLERLPWVVPPVVPTGHVHGYQAYVTLFAPERPTFENAGAMQAQRNAIMMVLEEKGIATRQGTHAPVNTGFYAHKYSLSPSDFPSATIAEKLTLTLPLYPQLTADEQTLVVDSLEAAFHA